MSYLFLVILLILISDSLVSASEAAIFSVPMNRVRQLAENSSNAKVLLSLKESMSGPTTTLIALSNLITILGSVTVGVVTAERLGDAWVGFVGAILTFLIMIFAEIIPKRLGERYATNVALVMARPIKAVSVVFLPITWFIEKMTSPFLPNGSISVSKEEIMFLTRQGAKDGSIPAYEGQLIQGVFRLADVTAGDMMTPKPFVFFLDGKKTVKEVIPLIEKRSHSRVPVYEEHKEKVTGVVRVRELLLALNEGKGETLVKEYARKPLVIPEARLGEDLLKDFLAAKSHLAIVVDDYGSMVGVVGLEDVLEEIVGEIVDEKDVRPELIKRVARNIIVTHGQTHIPHINHFFNTAIKSKKTLNGFLLQKLGHLPSSGESFKFDNLDFFIEEVSPSSVERVKITKEEGVHNA
ncbi:MAG: hemolysin family protein [bacterium]|nr:hemolysin family protein [bacterium]